MRLDPVRMAVAALELGPNIALAPFLSPPPDRARCTHAKSLRRRSTRQSAPNRANDTCEGQRIRIWPCAPAPFAGQKHESEPSQFGNLEASVRSRGAKLRALRERTSLTPERRRGKVRVGAAMGFVSGSSDCRRVGLQPCEASMIVLTSDRMQIGIGPRGERAPMAWGEGATA